MDQVNGKIYEDEEVDSYYRQRNNPPQITGIHALGIIFIMIIALAFIIANINYISNNR